MVCSYCGGPEHTNDPCPLASTTFDPVNNPKGYTLRPVKPPGEVIDVIESWQLPYLLGNVVKYIARYREKGAPLQDLKKARWYLDRAIANMELGGERK